MGCYGHYPGIEVDCRQCRVSSSCRRYTKELFCSGRKKRSARVVKKACLFDRVKAKLLFELSFASDYMSTNQVADEVSRWKTCKAGYYIVMKALDSLHKEGFLLLSKKGKGFYWLVKK
jgi:hypothetical protein